jgi:antagonist of KipI
MSIKIIKQGIADSIQDLGRFGYQHLGINPTGAMDVYAAQIANMIVGNDLNEAVIELHFPAAVFLFQQQSLIALSGADFCAMINDIEVPINTPIIIEKNCILQFKKIKQGARCYLAIKEGLNVPLRLKSYSTNIKANAGGHFGRYLQKNDSIAFNTQKKYCKLLNKKDAEILHWKVDVKELYTEENTIRIIKGEEYHWLQTESKELIESSSFIISSQSDRMGFRMKGEQLKVNNKEQLLSTAVTKGTVQLLPNGQLIVLMADHQTTGGYPRIAHIISADISTLSQLSFHSSIQFELIELEEAENILYKHHQYLQLLQNACNFRLQEYFQQHEPD